MTTTLPDFHITAYRDLLLLLKRAGYTLSPVTCLTEPGGQLRVHLRHDVDFFPPAALRMAEVEYSAECASTYYFLVSAQYNLRASVNRRVVARLIELGHEIGLHYDLQTYPTDRAAAEQMLAEEVRVLEDISEQRIRTICMHNPHVGTLDWFIDCNEYVHPHSLRWHNNLLYVSDSCRAWRDEKLLECFSHQRPQRVLFATHPELWLDGSVIDRVGYLERVLIPTMTRPIEAYMKEEVREIWTTHAAALAHDARTNSHLWFTWADRQYVIERLGELEACFREFVELPWTFEQLLRELPGKWQNSLVVTKDEGICAFSFNSLKEDWLYVDAFFVTEALRRQGLGGIVMKEVKCRAESLGLNGVRLRVDWHNRRAIDFYSGHGFRVQKVEPEGRMLVLEVRLNGDGKCV